MRLKFTLVLLGAAVLMGLILGSSVVQAEKIRILSTSTNAPQVAVMKEFIAAFENENPGVTVELELISWGDLGTRIMADVAAGTEPELIQSVFNSDTAYYQTFGLLLPVSDVIDKLGRDDYRDGTLVEIDGENYLVPTEPFATGLWYRADLLANKGLASPNTWEDLLEAAEILTEDLDGDGKIDRWGYTMQLGDSRWTPQNFVLYYWQNGGKVFDKDFNIAFDKPPYRQLMIETFEFYKKLSKYTPPGSVDYAWWESYQAFATGVVAMGNGFYRHLTLTAETSPEFLPYVRVTYHPYKKDKKIRASMADVSGYAMMKNSDNPELAKKLLLFLMRRDRLIEWMHAIPGGPKPSRDSIFNSEEWQDHPLLRPHMADLNILMNSMKFGFYWPFEWTRETGKANWVATPVFNSPIMVDMVKGVILFNKDVEEAIDEAAKKARELVAAQRKLFERKEKELRGE